MGREKACERPAPQHSPGHVGRNARRSPGPARGGQGDWTQPRGTCRGPFTKRLDVISLPVTRKAQGAPVFAVNPLADQLSKRYQDHVDGDLSLKFSVNHTMK